jgi:hypothetical protein
LYYYDGDFPGEANTEIIMTFMGEEELVDMLRMACDLYEERTWRVLKEKAGEIRGAYSAPAGRFNASGQGDPDAAFVDFVRQRDKHPRAVRVIWHLLRTDQGANVLTWFDRGSANARDSFDNPTGGSPPAGRRRPAPDNDIGTILSNESVRELLANPAAQDMAQLYRTQRLQALASMPESLLTSPMRERISFAVYRDILDVVRAYDGPEATAPRRVRPRTEPEMQAELPGLPVLPEPPVHRDLFGEMMDSLPGGTDDFDAELDDL